MKSNKQLKRFLKEQDSILKNAKRVRQTAGQVLARVSTAIENQKAMIEATIASGKNFNLLNAAHDRMKILEDYYYTVETIKDRGQYAPTYEEMIFDGWVD